MRKVIATAPGKIILFGEHAVVWNYPAIAMAISLRTTCQIETINQGITLIFQDFGFKASYPNLNELNVDIPKKFKQISFCLEKINQEYDKEISNIMIIINSEILPGSGLGSSASVAVALIAALNRYYNLDLDKHKISDFAFEMEKITHGKPSGIDNTICTHGNLIFFQGMLSHSIYSYTNFTFLITYTNIRHNTKVAVNNVKEFKEKYPSKTQQIFLKIGICSIGAEQELIKGNIKELGDLMNKNQKLLEQLNLSNDSISEIINISLSNGAYGSKITGAGLGGCVITLGIVKTLHKISSLLNERGYQSFIVKKDSRGVFVE